MGLSGVDSPASEFSGNGFSAAAADRYLEAADHHTVGCLGVDDNTSNLLFMNPVASVHHDAFFSKHFRNTLKAAAI